MAQPPRESIRSSAYGCPFSITAADYNVDGAAGRQDVFNV